jgi:3'-phosphoadenosine 5'-phosphosulfate sulfotransferase (PAPS reductase)/FAD synthetase
MNNPFEIMSDVKIIVNVSGGKDSTAMLLYALNHYPKSQIIPIYADTGFEHPVTYEYLQYLERALGVRIARVKSDKYNDMIDMIWRRQRYPMRLLRNCTYWMKQKPIINYLKTISTAEQWIGIRSNESQNRKQKYGGISQFDIFTMKEFTQSAPKLKHITIRLPIVNWSESDVFKVLSDNSIERNPLYDAGHKRVGCFPCIISGIGAYQRVLQDTIGKRNILRLFDLAKYVNYSRGKEFRINSGYSNEEFKRIVVSSGSMFDDDNETVCGFCAA